MQMPWLHQPRWSLEVARSWATQHLRQGLALAARASRAQQVPVSAAWLSLGGQGVAGALASVCLQKQSPCSRVGLSRSWVLEPQRLDLATTSALALALLVLHAPGVVPLVAVLGL